MQIQNFYQQGGSTVFACFLKASFFALLFEENKNIWLFNKVLLSCLVLVNLAGQGVLQSTILELVDANEKNPEHR